MRDTLVYLTHLNCEDTESIMLSKLSDQARIESQFDWNILNTLSLGCHHPKISC